MTSQRLTLTKRVLLWGWGNFILICALSFLAIASLFFPLYYILETQVRSISDGLLVSLLVPVGMSPYTEFSSTGKLLIVAEGLVSAIWFAIVTAFIVARIGNPRTMICFAPVVAFCKEEPTGRLPRRKDRYLLEFRMVVHPSPPILAPEIWVSYCRVNILGERDTLPLEVLPVQAISVRYYLVFRAVVPPELLVREARKTLTGKPVQGTVDVLIKAVDSRSDATLNILQQYAIPNDVREGSFADAVTLDDQGNITGILEDSLLKVNPPNAH